MLTCLIEYFVFFYQKLIKTMTQLFWGVKLNEITRDLPLLSTQVCLYFHHKLFRGNRVTKVDAGSFDAFNSPNLAPLANAEVDIKSN